MQRRRGGRYGTLQWNMATSWPSKLPGLGVDAVNFARRIERASAWRLKNAGPPHPSRTPPKGDLSR